MVDQLICPHLTTVSVEIMIPNGCVGGVRKKMEGLSRDVKLGVNEEESWGIEREENMEKM